MPHASTRAALSTAISIAVVAALIYFLLPKYWVYIITPVFIVGVTLQSLGLVTGRTGMISLAQMSFAGVGAWVTGYLNVAQFPGGLIVWMIIGVSPPFLSALPSACRRCACAASTSPLSRSVLPRPLTRCWGPSPIQARPLSSK